MIKINVGFVLYIKDLTVRPTNGISRKRRVFALAEWTWVEFLPNPAYQAKKTDGSLVKYVKSTTSEKSYCYIFAV